MALLLTEEDVQKALTMEACLEVVEEAFRQRGSSQAMVRPRTRMAMPNGTHMLMASWVGGPVNAYGLKSYGGVRGGTGRGARPIVLLYDGATGAFLAILEAGRLGQVRTGASSGVATRFMARQDATTVGLIGTGNQAVTQLEAVCHVRTVRQVWAYSRTPERREAFAREQEERLGVPITPAASAEECVREADVVITITNSAEPVLQGQWLREGAHVNAAGGNNYLRHELNQEAVRRSALVVVDDLAQARTECGELMAAAERGVLRWEQVFELGDVVAGRVPGRPSPTAITLFESQGIASEDVAAALVTYNAARELGLGQEIPL